jgi:hypothetical protein
MVREREAVQLREAALQPMGQKLQAAQQQVREPVLDAGQACLCSTRTKPNRRQLRLRFPMVRR